jgi:hypothetical protein
MFCLWCLARFKKKALHGNPKKLFISQPLPSNKSLFEIRMVYQDQNFIFGIKWIISYNQVIECFTAKRLSMVIKRSPSSSIYYLIWDGSVRMKRMGQSILWR